MHTGTFHGTNQKPKPEAQPGQSEAQLQSRCAMWFKNTYRSLRLMFYMIPNDGKKNIITANIDKARGLTAGIPDTFLSVPRQGFHGLYVEFKTLLGAIGPEQKKAMEQLKAQGYRVEICRTETEFQNLITDYLGNPEHHLGTPENSND